MSSSNADPNAGDGGAVKVGGARLAARHTRRVLLTGDGAMLLAALVVAVAAVAAVGQLTERVRAALIDQSAQTLGADLRLRLTAPLDAERRRLLAREGVRTAAVRSFPSAVTRGDALMLVSVQAVSPNYPLRGALTLRAGRPGSATRRIARGPPTGTVWVDPRVLAKLGVEAGQTLTLGRSRFTIGAVVVNAPDRGPGFTNIAPRVFMNDADVAGTGLAGPGSRIRYDVLIAGNRDRIRATQAALAPTLAAGERLTTPAGANRGLARALDRADVFLDLAALVAVVLAGVAIALSARQHARSRRDEIALYKTLGAPSGLIARLLAWQLVYIGALGVALGIALGGLTQTLIGMAVSKLFDIALPPPAWSSLWAAPAVGAVLLAGFAWPALAAARRAPPARVFARALDTVRDRGWPLYAGAAAAVVLMAATATRDLTLTAWVVGAALAGTALFAAAGAAALSLVARVRGRIGGRLGPGVRLGLAAIVRRRATTIIQIAAFGVGLTLIFMLVIVRGDLLSGWQAGVATDAPNRFLINITPRQTRDIERYLSAHDIRRPRLFPIVRGRLIRVDGRALDDDPELARAAGDLARRALNLSWAARLKNDNRLVDGRWFDAGDRGEHRISLAQSIADRLDIGVGDRLTFDIAGRRLTAEIISLRDIDWSSLQANFYVLFPPGVLAADTASYITSFYLSPGRDAALAGLVRRFPNVSVIDIAAILKQVETLIARVSLAVELVFGFTLAAAFVVLLAAVGTTRAERRREAAVLRALGAHSRWLLQATVLEFALVGLIAAVLAAIVAQVCAALLAANVLDLDYAVRWGAWITGIAIAVLAIALAGALSLGDTRREPAWTSLRASD